jgi:hypothetical protein
MAPDFKDFVLDFSARIEHPLTLSHLLEEVGRIPLKTWKQCEAELNCMETGSINHAKHNGGKTLKGYRNEHNPDGSLTTVYVFSDGSCERVMHTKWASLTGAGPTVRCDTATKTQAVVQPAVVEKIHVTVQLNTESEGERIMRITREMAGG